MLYAVLVTLPRVGCGTFDAAWDVCVRHGVTAWLQAAFSDAFNVQSTKATAAPTAAVRLHTHTHMPITYCRAHANAYTRPRTPRAHTCARSHSRVRARACAGADDGDRLAEEAALRRDGRAVRGGRSEDPLARGWHGRIRRASPSGHMAQSERCSLRLFPLWSECG